MIELANLKKDEVILDLGTGAGFLAIGFGKYLTNGKIFGLDKYKIKNENYMSKLKSIIKINFFGNTYENACMNAEKEGIMDRCKFIQADLTESFNFPDDFFDIIISSQFLYCISDIKRKKILKEINRVIKKEGKFIFFEPDSTKDWNVSELEDFYENKGFCINVIKDVELKGRCIIFGKKL